MQNNSQFSPPRGGTELMIEKLIHHCGSAWQNLCNIMLTVPPTQSVTRNHKPNVLWCHLNEENDNVQGLKDEKNRDAIDHFVFVSQTQSDRFIKKFELSVAKTLVISNAIQPIPFVPRSNTGKLQLIYTSMPWRGLHLLLDIWQQLDRQDVELVIYSSLEIYGSEYAQATQHLYQHILDRAATTPGVIFRGYGSNDQVRQSLSQAHIFAYPSVFAETSCLSAIEAGAAGCNLLVTDFGALPETCQQWADYVPFTINKRKLMADFVEKIHATVDNYWSQQNQMHLQQQSEWFNSTYDWDARQHEWHDFFRSLNPQYDSTTAPPAAPAFEAKVQQQVWNTPISLDIPMRPPVSTPPTLAASALPPVTRRVMVGTPSYDGKVEAWYMNSLLQCVKMSIPKGIDITTTWVSYDSLIQRARNDVLHLAIEGGFDDLIMIDADIEWQPQWLFDLLDYPVDVVGGTYPKKGDAEIYVVQHMKQVLEYNAQGLLKVDGLGTGFLRMSRKACQHLYDSGTPYFHNNRHQRWVFNVGIQDGDIMSEDIDMCHRLRDAGFDIWLDPGMTCNHIGIKKFTGDFQTWIKTLNFPEVAATTQTEIATMPPAQPNPPMMPTMPTRSDSAFAVPPVSAPSTPVAAPCQTNLGPQRRRL
jgi:glycosyltransferase involved in cell wall biosynthesis